MTYIYIVENDESGSGSGQDYFPTKKKAVEFAREVADSYPVEVYRITVADLPRRELLVALLMHEGWGMGNLEVVATIPPSREIDYQIT
jgi:hypothetical protein